MGVGVGTGREARIRAARKLRMRGPILVIAGPSATCRFCGNTGAARYMRYAGEAGRSECRGAGACEERMR
jgi:hypothetical protein